MALIKANHKGYAHFVFVPYLNYIMRQSFHSLNLLGELPESYDDRPMLVLPNHSTWWDGFFIYTLNRLFWKKKYHVMMLEEQLLKYPFFSKLGAFSIKQSNAKDIITSLNYAGELLQNADNLINIYPQGILRPHFVRPLSFAKGSDYLLRDFTGDLDVVLVAMRIEYLSEKKPSVFFKFEKMERKMFFTAKAEESLTRLLSEIDESLLMQNYGIQIFPKTTN